MCRQNPSAFLDSTAPIFAVLAHLCAFVDFLSVQYSVTFIFVRDNMNGLLNHPVVLKRHLKTFSPYFARFGGCLVFYHLRWLFSSTTNIKVTLYIVFHVPRQIDGERHLIAVPVAVSFLLCALQLPLAVGNSHLQMMILVVPNSVDFRH